MFSHITVGVTDLARAGRFYDALLAPLGFNQRKTEPDGGPEALCWIGANRLPEFFAHRPFNGAPAQAGNGNMVALLAPDPGAVDAAYAAGMAAGGTDEGPPGPRPHYGAGYYGAYLRDPDGNKVHVVHRGDVTP
ncbi:VOC family protein [Azorhizobium caulinodans]|uniref:VOC family protein n=1 Tax=Azorhizobium caulinodans TaxID=7 RepID=UPI002FBDF68D